MIVIESSYRALAVVLWQSCVWRRIRERERGGGLVGYLVGIGNVLLWSGPVVEFDMSRRSWSLVERRKGH